MKGKNRQRSHKRKSDIYLRDTERQYSLNLMSGLYEPNSLSGPQETSEKTDQKIQGIRPKGSYADWAGVSVNAIQVAVGIVTLMGLGVTVLLGVRQLSEADRTANASIDSANAAKSAADTAKSAAHTASNELELSQRPWILADVSLTAPLVFDANGVSVGFSVTMKNVGRSPAIHTDPTVTLVALQSVSDIAKYQAQINCKSTIANHAQDSFGDFGVTLFPDGPPTTRSYQGTLSNKEIEDGLLKNVRPGYRGLELYLVGCVLYESSFDRAKLYSTGVAYRVGEPLLPVDVGVSIPLDRLKLIRPPFDLGSYAY